MPRPVRLLRKSLCDGTERRPIRDRLVSTFPTLCEPSAHQDAGIPGAPSYPPWGGRADASGRVALHATALCRTTCSVSLPGRAGRSFESHGPPLESPELVAVPCPACRCSPVEVLMIRERKAISVVSTVRSHLHCRFLDGTLAAPSDRVCARIDGSLTLAMVLW